MSKRALMRGAWRESSLPMKLWWAVAILVVSHHLLSTHWADAADLATFMGLVALYQIVHYDRMIERITSAALADEVVRLRRERSK